MVLVPLTLLDDRYQKPRGGYRDILMLLKINGYACELQFNTDEVLVVKEGLGHKQYESTRMVNDDLLDAAMRSDTPAAKRALEQKAEPNTPRDMYALTPLHYAAHHGSMEVVEALLNHKADVFAKDHEGRLAIHRAVLSIYIKKGSENLFQQ